MSVIAKMNVVDVREFGRAGLVKLSCVYESNGLNANNEGWENRRFTTATPWGEGELTTPRDGLFKAPATFEHGGVNAATQQAVYIVFRAVGDVPACPPLLSMPVKVKHLDLGSYKRVEIVLDRDRAGPEKDTALNLRLSIDNPAALEQFTPGGLFDMAVYDAGGVSLQDAAA